MVKVKAIIKLYNNEKGRKTPFISGYRPLFNFIAGMKTSGQITLINKAEFSPGDKVHVEIQFISKSYLGDDFREGKKFTFGEGGEPLGEGEIEEILE